MKSQREATWHSAWQTVYTQWKLSKVLSLFFLGFLGGSVVEDPPVNAGDTGDLGSIPGSWRAPGEGNGNPPQYSCLGNPMDRGAWRATAHRVTESQTRLSTRAVIYLLGIVFRLSATGSQVLWLVHLQSRSGCSTFCYNPMLHSEKRVSCQLILPPFKGLYH